MSDFPTILHRVRLHNENRVGMYESRNTQIIRIAKVRDGVWHVIGIHFSHEATSPRGWDYRESPDGRDYEVTEL